MTTQFVEMGKRIASRRKNLGLTQNQLAEILEISNNHLSSIENGKQSPSFEKFIKLCEALETTPNDLVLGCIHTKDVEQNIIDTIQLCDEKTTELIYDLVNFLYARSLDKALK
jgi:transcriptional regulator with XRE-family HTH domain